MIRKHHNHKLQANPWYRDEDPHNNHETPVYYSFKSHLLTFNILILNLICYCNNFIGSDKEILFT